MKLFRIAKQKYITDFSGEGARLYGGRWNKRGTHMLYFSTSLSLCVLEILVHFNQDLAPKGLYFTEVEISKEYIDLNPNLKSVKKYLRDNPPHFSTQQFGSSWAAKNSNLGLSVPSAIIPSENNVIVNPLHASISKLKMIKKSKLDLDTRLFI